MSSIVQSPGCQTFSKLPVSASEVTILPSTRNNSSPTCNPAMTAQPFGDSSAIQIRSPSASIVAPKRAVPPGSLCRSRLMIPAAETSVGPVAEKTICPLSGSWSPKSDTESSNFALLKRAMSPDWYGVSSFRMARSLEWSDLLNIPPIVVPSANRHSSALQETISLSFAAI